MPLVAAAAVTLVNDPHVIGLDDPKVFECGTSGYDMGLVPLGKLHGHPQRDQPKFPGPQLYILGAPQIDPIRYASDIRQFINFIRKILYFDRLHSLVSPLIPVVMPFPPILPSQPMAVNIFKTPTAKSRGQRSFFRAAPRPYALCLLDAQNLVILIFHRFFEHVIFHLAA